MAGKQSPGPITGATPRGPSSRQAAAGRRSSAHRLPSSPPVPVHQPAPAEVLQRRGRHRLRQGPRPARHSSQRLLLPRLGRGGSGGIGRSIQAHKPIELAVCQAKGGEGRPGGEDGEVVGWAAAAAGGGASSNWGWRAKSRALVATAACSSTTRLGTYKMHTHLRWGTCQPSPPAPTPAVCSRPAALAAARRQTAPPRAPRSARSSLAAGAPPPPPSRCVRRRRPPQPGTPGAGQTPASQPPLLRSPRLPTPARQTPGCRWGAGTPGLPAAQRRGQGEKPQRGGVPAWEALRLTAASRTATVQQPTLLMQAVPAASWTRHPNPAARQPASPPAGWSAACPGPRAARRRTRAGQTAAGGGRCAAPARCCQERGRQAQAGRRGAVGAATDERGLGAQQGHSSRALLPVHAPWLAALFSTAGSLPASHL